MTGATEILIARGFNLDDVGTEVGEVPRADRTGAHTGKVKDAQSGQRRGSLDSGHGVVSVPVRRG